MLGPLIVLVDMGVYLAAVGMVSGPWSRSAARTLQQPLATCPASHRSDAGMSTLDQIAIVTFLVTVLALLVWIAWTTARDRRRYWGRQIAFEVDEPTEHGPFRVYTTNPEQIARGEQ
jgi:hypothetical protein